MKFEFSRHTFETVLISSFIKIRPLGAELFHADRQMVMKKKLIVA